MRKNFGFLGICFGALLLGLFYRREKLSQMPAPEPGSLSADRGNSAPPPGLPGSPRLDAPRVPGSVPHAKGSLVSPQFQKSNDERWREFSEKFGADLVPQFNSNGQLVSVRGAPGKGALGPSDFKVQDPLQVIQRGSEILTAAQGLLGLTSELPLGAPISRSGPVTAQLYFQETYHGLSLLPEGSLKIDIGPQGEILGIHSEYLANMKVVSNEKISQQEAFTQALNSAGQHDQLSGLPPVQGKKVVWVTHPTEGRVAYQFFIHGREIIVDAGSGEVLSSRNRRQE